MWLCRGICFLLCLSLFSGAGRAAESKADARERILEVWRTGQYTNALNAANEAIAAAPKEARLLALRAQMRAILHDHTNAVADLSAALKLEPDSTFLVRERAVEYFRLGRFAESVADFDRLNELLPAVAPQNWQRGISLYYAGRFGEGRKQFELHQTVNPDDVENAVWHFLCTAREQGVAAARKQLIPITGDTRVPMKEIHNLFAGKAKPEDVLAAAKANDTSPDGQKYQNFYAHLYLGLYFEATGDASQVREHILAAVQLGAPEDYMTDVARVHAQRLLAAASSK
jgi:lipoprotein NlpI